MEGITLHKLSGKKPEDDTASVSSGLLLPVFSSINQDIQKCIDEFWQLSMPVRLFSVSDAPHYYWHTNDFYVAQKGLDKEGKCWAQLRISEGLCQYLFETTLGKPTKNPDFTLASIKSFEVFLLERFSRKLFQAFSPILLKRSPLKTGDPKMELLFHGVWVLKGQADQTCQVVLTAPQAYIKSMSETLSSTKWQLPDTLFLNAHSNVRIGLGKTAARLDELQNLEAGDIILFEESNTEQWHLWDPISNQWLAVAIKIPSGRIVRNLSETQGLNMMIDDAQIKQNIWDSLQVEVTASFDPVRLPLKQVKEMEQGLVVEVGDLMDNRVTIEVEGHAVAWGELLVLGDKFGVRIQGLNESSSQYVDQTSGIYASSEQSTTHLAPTTAVTESSSDNMEKLMDLDLDESDFDDLDDDDEDWA